MPTPLVHEYVGAQAYANLPVEKRSQDIGVFYATDRRSRGPAEAREYGNGFSGHLSLGKTVVSCGKRPIHWKELVTLSTRHERGEPIPLIVRDARELDTLPQTNGANFAAEVNKVLSTTRYPDITIYVVGAQSSFPQAVVEGAQFHHFMVRETALIAYSWPSTGKFLGYGRDVAICMESAPRLTDLIEFLAANTSARRINLLSYSAGAQVLGPALAELRSRYPEETSATLRKQFRLGRVYLAAADIGFKKFAADYLPAFADIVENVTVTYQEKDKVLTFAQKFHQGESRLGRPDPGELAGEEVRELERLAKEGKVDGIDMNYPSVSRPVNFETHQYWFRNEWVSSDAIIQFLYGVSPGDRGLEKKPGIESWYFPEDYPARLREIVRKSGP